MAAPNDVWMNGDGLALAEFLSCFALVAFAANAAFGGKTWCNSFCPVGFVERLYTSRGSSACSALARETEDAPNT